MIVVACATEFPPSEATDPPLESATAIPTAEPTEATPTADPVDLATAAAARAALDEWVAEMEDVEPDVASRFTDVRDAYDTGSTDDRSVALDSWLAALKSTHSVGWNDPEAPKDDPHSVGCWGRVADLYTSEFQAMEQTAQDLLDEISFGPTSSGQTLPGQRLAPRDALLYLESKYEGSLAGELTADDIERFCAAGTVAAPPLPRPETGIEFDGVRFGDPFIVGSLGFVLVENTTDQPVELGGMLRFGPGGGTLIAFYDSAGRRLAGVYNSTVRWVGPHQTAAVSLYGSGVAPPKSWRTARVEPGVLPTSAAAPPLQAYAPGAMSTSLGPLVSARVENLAETRWCAAVTAIAMNDDQIVAGGWEDASCADPHHSWVEVVRLEGRPTAVSAIYVELLAASPG